MYTHTWTFLFASNIICNMCLCEPLRGQYKDSTRHHATPCMVAAKSLPSSVHWGNGVSRIMTTKDWSTTGCTSGCHGNADKLQFAQQTETERSIAQC